jgi:hypothetical protein
MPRRDLWAARIPGQIFVVEQHRKALTSGPGLVFSALIPDFDHFKGSEGGRALPWLHPDGSPNVAPSLLGALTAVLGREVRATDVVAYGAAVVTHPAYTLRFTQELSPMGLRPVAGEIVSITPPGGHLTARPILCRVYAGYIGRHRCAHDHAAPGARAPGAAGQQTGRCGCRQLRPCRSAGRVLAYQLGDTMRRCRAAPRSAGDRPELPPSR